MADVVTLDAGFNPFVEPETVKIDLGWDGHFIIVRKRLTVGQVKQLQSAGWRNVGQDARTGDHQIGIDWPKMHLARVTAYVVDWSFRSKTNKPIAVTPMAIEALAEPVFDLMSAKIDEHVAAVTAEGKQTPGASAPTSNS